MAEYIERKKALESVREKLLITDALPDGIPKDASTFTLASMQHSLESIPAADVRPVVRGHKVTHNRPIAGYWASGKLDGGWDGMEGRVWVEPIMDNPVDYCSECGKRLDDTFQNFCPNCGAMMEES